MFGLKWPAIALKETLPWMRCEEEQPWKRLYSWRMVVRIGLQCSLDNESIKLVHGLLELLTDFWKNAKMEFFGE